jgi:hypothetical protein
MSVKAVPPRPDASKVLYDQRTQILDGIRLGHFLPGANLAVVPMPLFVLAFIAAVAAIVMLAVICSGIAVITWAHETGESHHSSVLVVLGESIVLFWLLAG